MALNEVQARALQEEIHYLRDRRDQLELELRQARDRLAVLAEQAREALRWDDAEDWRAALARIARVDGDR